MKRILLIPTVALELILCAVGNSFSSPSEIYRSSPDTTVDYIQVARANNEGSLWLHLSLPHINSFHLRPENEPAKTNTGFWGLTVGVDYYHSPEQFVSLTASYVTDFFIPVPGPVTLTGEHEMLRSAYTCLTNNHRTGRFTMGYGLTYAENTWKFSYEGGFNVPPPSRELSTKSSAALGLMFPAYYRFGEHFTIGLMYRPTFFRPNAVEKFLYEHVCSIDVAWKIQLRK
jgi:hypothetical protein